MNYKDFNVYELVSQITENEEATDILFEKYRPLIYSTAKRLYAENNPSGLDLNDLVQEGMIGFSVALSTYNEHKDTLFFTYAKKCIETKIISAVVGANRKKHTILNTSISMEAIDGDDVKASLDKFIGDNESNPESIIIDREDVNLLVKRLEEEFTDFECQVFDLRKNGFTYREIAEVLDTDPKKIDNALQRIKHKVKNYLDNHKENL